MNVQKIKAVIEQISSIEKDDIKQFSPLIESVALGVKSQLQDESLFEDKRVVLYTAAKALVAMCSADSMLSAGTSFKVGDISVTQSEGSSSGCDALLSYARECCRDLLCDNSFSFRSV